MPGVKRSGSLSLGQQRLIAKALADPRRFDILAAIAACDGVPCTDLREQFPITAATMSHHLKELETAGLIDGEKEGKFIRLHFQRPIWELYLAALKKL
jgi:ArsR family transcriptional regulator, arsenate/arsenite/antimonite-responsive transcriptional repressor